MVVYSCLPTISPRVYFFKGLLRLSCLIRFIADKDGQSTSTKRKVLGLSVNSGQTGLAALFCFYI